MRHIILLLTIVLTAGCVQNPPTTADVQGKRFESVADKAVIYIVRPRVDSPTAGPLSIGNFGMISTHPGTYFRWEAAPGVQRIEGFGPFSSSVTVQAEAGKIYFVEQNVMGNQRDGIQSMSLRRTDEIRGRRMVSEAQML